MARGRKKGSVTVRSGKYTKVARAQARYANFQRRCSNDNRQSLKAAVAAAAIKVVRAARKDKGVKRGPRRKPVGNTPITVINLPRGAGRRIVG